jgi:hypothetical protein
LCFSLSHRHAHASVVAIEAALVDAKLLGLECGADVILGAVRVVVLVPKLEDVLVTVSVTATVGVA